MIKHTLLTIVLGCLLAASASAEKYYLLNGVDTLLYPGVARSVPGDNGVGNYPDFYDGDRLAGTSDVGPTVPYYGILPQNLMYQPNEFGSLSMLYRRGSVPFISFNPLMGIEFLGGPLLDLDGDPNAPRSLVPVGGATPVEIPGTDSFIELNADTSGGTVTLVDIDTLGTNEGGPGQAPETATILITIAGTQPDGSKNGPINPGIDTRSGTLTPFLGNSGTLSGVYQIDNLGYELWEDSIDPAGSSPDVLGSMQFLGTFRGWLVQRDPVGGTFPVLTGEGLGSTLWPLVDVSQVGNTFNTALGGTASIGSSSGTDDFTAAGNGGLALTDFTGDLGGYFDTVVLAALPVDATSYIYLEAAGFGLSNSADPVFGNTVGYDAVFVAAATDPCAGTTRCDANCDGFVNNGDIDAFIVALDDQATWEAQFTCDFFCANDANEDGYVNNGDIDSFVASLTGK